MDYPNNFQFEPVVPEISAFKQTNSTALYIKYRLLKKNQNKMLKLIENIKCTLGF